MTTILRLLRGLAGEGTAVLVVDHDTELLAEHASRILVLADGRLVADGPPATVLGDLAAMDGGGRARPRRDPGRGRRPRARDGGDAPCP